MDKLDLRASVDIQRVIEFFPFHKFGPKSDEIRYLI